jgi:hypothetical protein
MRLVFTCTIDEPRDAIVEAIKGKKGAFDADTDPVNIDARIDELLKEGSTLELDDLDGKFFYDCELTEVEE